jgi:type II secretion system protein I
MLAITRGRRLIPGVITVRSPEGFTLLEVLVALVILGIAVATVLQLFSANLRSIGASEDLSGAVLRAEARFREILGDEALDEKAWSEAGPDGARYDIAVTETLKERTDNLQIRHLEVVLTMHWKMGAREKSLTLRTAKLAPKAKPAPQQQKENLFGG